MFNSPCPPRTRDLIRLRAALKYPFALQSTIRCAFYFCRPYKFCFFDCPRARYLRQRRPRSQAQTDAQNKTFPHFYSSPCPPGTHCHCRQKINFSYPMRFFNPLPDCPRARYLRQRRPHSQAQADAQNKTLPHFYSSPCPPGVHCHCRQKIIYPPNARWQSAKYRRPSANFKSRRAFFFDPRLFMIA